MRDEDFRPRGKQQGNRIESALSMRCKVLICGELAGIRTQDPRLKRALLYQLSYELTG
jgi:hypothetical protein